ncbi:hypothetical protein JTB14_018299 [Gonioctena quinquepunctata]|nr:hypothetical protein JTB14_018299 [Gonioctena quinquepunctata]
MGLTEAAKEAIYLHRFLTELGLNHLTAIVIFNDDMSAEELAENPVLHARSKHIDIKSHFIREATKSDELKDEYLSTNEMPTDIMTKTSTVRPNVRARVFIT